MNWDELLGIRKITGENRGDVLARIGFVLLEMLALHLYQFISCGRLFVTALGNLRAKIGALRLEKDVFIVA